MESHMPLESRGALRKDDACAFLNLSVSTFERLVKEGRAPQPIRITPRRPVWLVETLKDWLVNKGVIMPTPVKLVPPNATIEKQNMLDMLEKLRTNIESGKTIRFGMVQVYADGFATEFSSGTHTLQDGALLIQLGMRMLGLAGDNPDAEQ